MKKREKNQNKEKSQEAIEVFKAVQTPSVADIINITASTFSPWQAEVNGVQEDKKNPKMPFLKRIGIDGDEWSWDIKIDIKTGEVIGWTKEVNARIHYPISGCVRIRYGGKTSFCAFIPDFLVILEPQTGDYILLSIENGIIVDWSEEKCREFLLNTFPAGEESDTQGIEE